MSLTLPADAGEPLSAILHARSKIACHKFPALTRQVSVRNTGTNTLWFSFDQQVWHEIACGTSWEDRVSIRELWHCTQVGQTSVAVVGLALL